VSTIRQMRDAGESWAEIARRTGLARATCQKGQDRLIALHAIRSASEQMDDDFFWLLMACAEFVLGCWLAFRLRDWMVDALVWFLKTISCTPKRERRADSTCPAASLAIRLSSSGATAR
jgi:hypothetical protein